jgi:hypothetical protein
MSLSETQLRTLFIDAFRQIDKNRPAPEIEVKFYPYAGLHHTIRLRGGRVYVRISDIFRDAPLPVHRALSFILVSKLLRKKMPASHDSVYREYTCQPGIMRAADIARRRRGRKIISSAQGHTYDLEKMFTRLNRKYFGSKLERPVLTWSQRRTRHILGHHDAVHNTIVISKSLDSHDVPEWVVEYILYHEMLHIKHPARLINGRRYYHTKAFRTEEQKFPHYEEAQVWLERISRQRRIPRAA